MGLPGGAGSYQVTNRSLIVERETFSRICHAIVSERWKAFFRGGWPSEDGSAQALAPACFGTMASARPFPVSSHSMKALPIILAVVGIALVGCGLVGWALLRVGSVSVDTPPPAVKITPGFDGELVDRWRQRRGGFTGDEALTPLESELSQQWPNGSVVELTLGGGDYELTVVEASGSGALLTKKLYRERGSWRQDSETTLTLSPEKAAMTVRERGERTTEERPLAARTYVMSQRSSEREGPPGASPSGTEALTLRGPCVTSGEACEWELEAE